jgi:pimeloyl-ACP methyl ester carboxylesterase
MTPADRPPPVRDAGRCEPHAKRALALAVVSMLAMAAMFSSAKCYPPGTRVVVFIQGIYTAYDAGGTQGSLVESHRFETLKAAFLARGYKASALLDFSYAGGTVGADGSWQPAPYGCELTDRLPDDNLAPLEKMLVDYRARHPDAHFTLVGHSLGGYLAFLEGARDAARPAANKLGVDVVVTLDAPLSGVSADKKAILDIVPCAKTYLAGADLVAQKLDPTTPATRRAQTAEMAAQGVRLATMGNPWDCLWNTGYCLPGGTWVDDSGTQFLNGEASISNAYAIQAPALASHDAIVADANVARDTVGFVGPP